MAKTVFDEAVAVAGRGYRDISPALTLKNKGRARWIDVREADELVGGLGRIAGVEHVPLATIDAAARTWNKNADIILICRSGVRSGRAADALVRMGFTRVMNMVGGMLAVESAGLPVIK